MNFTRATLAGIGLALVTTVSQAATIAIDPTSDSAPMGGTVNYSLTASDFTLGAGGLTLSYDSAVLTFDGFTFAASAGGGDNEFASLSAPGSLNITFGNFSPIAPAIVYPLAPPTLIGTFSFTMDGDIGASSALTMTDYLGGFFDFVNAPITMTYENGVATNPVPVPAAIWLFGSGLLGLVGIARRKKA